MACLHPVRICNPRYDSSRVVSADNLPSLLVPCGHCYYCRKARVDSLAMMVKHERVTCEKRSVFVTFTFNNRFLPRSVKSNVLSFQNDGVVYSTLDSFDFGKSLLQKFFKRLRRYISYHKLGYKFKYVACGEFGHKFGRPHYHAILLGVSYLQIASLVEKLWSRLVYEPSAGIRVRYPIGFVKVVPCDDKASYYVTKYMKKGDSSVWWSSWSPKYVFDSALRFIKGAKGMFPPAGQFPFYLYRDGVYHYGSAIRDCSKCPLLNQMKEIVLNCKRETRKYFLNAHKCAFGWMSTGIGKRYALEHLDEWISVGCINNGYTKDGEMMRMPIPRNYRNYFVQDSYKRVPKFFGLTYSQLYPSVDSWTDSFCNVMDSDSFERFSRTIGISKLPKWQLRLSSVQYAFYHLYRTWLASQQLPVDLGKDDFYEDSIRPTKYNSVFRL